MADLTKLDLNKITKDLKEQLKTAEESGTVEKKKESKWLKKKSKTDEWKKNLKKFYGTKNWIQKKQ